MLELSALSHGTAPRCATPPRTFPSSTSVNSLAGYDRLLRGFVKPFYRSISLILGFIVCAVNRLAAAQSASCSLLGNGVCETLPRQRGTGCHLSLHTATQNTEHLQCHQGGPPRTADPAAPLPAAGTHGEESGPQLGAVIPSLMGAGITLEGAA